MNLDPASEVEARSSSLAVACMEYMDFSIKKHAGKYKGQSVLILEGPLTRTTLTEFEDVVRAEKAAALIVDLSAVPYVDSDGLGAIIKAHVSMSKSGRKLALASVPARLQALLKVTGVGQIISSYATTKEAELKLRKK
ncbi:MAG: STAS domain-containing protein [Deltaproteobacteria bacterium]